MISVKLKQIKIKVYTFSEHLIKFRAFFSRFTSSFTSRPLCLPTKSFLFRSPALATSRHRRRSTDSFGLLRLFFDLSAATMGFENVWYSRPRKYGQGSRCW